MKICHFSDWHGKGTMLPKADVYVCTGDMLPNFPLIYIDMNNTNPWHKGLNHMKRVEYQAAIELVGEDPGPHPKGGTYVGRKLDPLREEKYQRKWIDLELQKGGFRRHMVNNPDAPVVCVRGNHDFTDLAPWIGGEVYEIQKHGQNQTFDLLGHTWGGIRGINWINGEWSDELVDREWAEEIKFLTNHCTMLLTHAPPQGIMDSEYGPHWGVNALASYINKRLYDGDENGWPKLRAHFFGHIHGANGSKDVDGLLFSNAATTHILYEI